MVTLAGVKDDDKNCTRSCTDAADCIVTTGYWKLKTFCDLVNLPIVYTHTPYKSSILVTCYWWAFAAITILLPHGPQHPSIHSLWSRDFICDIIVFYSYGWYWCLRQHTGFAVPLSMLKSYYNIGCRSPSLQNQYQYFMMTFLTLAHVCESRSGRMCRLFWRYFWCKSLVKSIRSFRWLFFQVCFGKKKLFYR